ncbi:MAG: sigma 54-interacting transcriptional regulator [Gudongella sp.]|nr:sigma 54-interacting transcriptional regulator [Gudongella sp.]
MVEKKKICFISHNRNTQEYITKQLITYLGEYVIVKGISFEELKEDDEIGEFDFYLTSSYDVCKKIFNQNFCNLNVLLADRALNIENIDKVFELERGTKALLVGNTYQTAARGINLINKIGINYLELIPYFPGCNPNIANGISTAITTGSAHLIPKNVKKAIDLGIVGLDLSTFVELITKLEIPNEVINNVSQNYLKEFYDLSLRIQMAALDNYDIKKKYEEIINTVSEAIISVDEKGFIKLINNWAENLLGIDKAHYIDKPFDELILNFNIQDILVRGYHLENEIKKIKGVNYVLNSTPIIDISERLAGAVFSLKKVGEVQKIETKIRRELKNRNHVAKYKFEDIIGKSDEIECLIQLSKKFAKTDFTILIEGESGTGKELIVQAIHNSSRRSLGPFVAINLAALPENLVESELFGYEEGAFTGAKKTGKHGLFEEAHNGTIFLDEIGDASLEVQKKLLRVLEEREVRRVGGNSIIPINVRVIAATNRDLFQMVKEDEFRSDLYYRLCAISLAAPALRDRGGDIIDLVINFSSRFFNGQRAIELSDEVKDYFLSYDWPGNIRELENVVNYLCTMLADDNYVSKEHLPMYMQKKHIDKGIRKQNKADLQNCENSRIETIIVGLNKIGQLKITVKILNEIKIASTFNKGVGRNYLRVQLLRNGEIIKDYKLRKLLDTLSTLGLIEQGVTKQGSRITDLGIEFLENI